MGLAATAWGHGSVASNDGATAWGGSDSGAYAGGTASGEGSTAWGFASTATADASTAWGNGADATGVGATAWGFGATASGIYSTAMGYSNVASGDQSMTWGGLVFNGNTASGQSSTAFGAKSTASGQYSTAWGFSTTAEGDYSTAFGDEAHAEGHRSIAIGLHSQPQSTDPKVSGDRSMALFFDSNSANANNGYDFTSTDKFALIGGEFVIGETQAEGAATGCIRYNDTDDALEFSNDCTSYSQFGSGASAPGSDTQIVFNDSGTLAADSGFTFNSATDDVTVGGDLTITGDDLIMNTNTAGYLLIGGGSDYSPTAISGDATLASDGAVTIAADAIEESMLKAVDAAADEECLTYETTTGDFEWEDCSDSLVIPGADRYVLFNDNGALGADATFSYNSATNDLTLSGGGFSITTPEGYIDIDSTAGWGSPFTAFNVADSGTSAWKIDTTGAATVNVTHELGNHFIRSGGLAIGSSTLSAGTQTLELDVTGDVGATNYCDASGNNCFTAGDVGAVSGSDSQIIFNDNGAYAGDSGFTFNSATDDVTVGGDLTITGDDLVMNTNTAGYLLMADGTNYNPTSAAGDVGVESGSFVINADAVEEYMLKAVDAAADEECLTYETTTGDFEWEDCNDGVDTTTAPGSSTEIIFNDGGVYGTDSNFTFNSVTDNLTIGGDLTITGDDLVMNTNTAGYLLIGGGSDYSPTAISGDATLASDGAVTIAADAIEESMLKAVDAAADEECLTYETTTGDFEWEDCNDGAVNVAGSDTQIQFNDSGTLAADSSFVFNSSTNSMGIAVTSPTYALEVAANSSDNALRIGDTINDTLMRISGEAAGTTAVLELGDIDSTGNATLFTVDTANDYFYFESGNVGIGTDSPGAKLEVVGDMYLTQGAGSGHNDIQFRINGTGLAFMGVERGATEHFRLDIDLDDDSTGDFRIQGDSDTDQFAFTSSGQLGVNTTTISSGDQTLELDVAGDVGATNYCDADGNNCFVASDVSAAATAPGNATEVIFNSGGGSFGADSGFTFNSATDDVTVGGDLTITGDDLVMNTNTAGYLLMADGTNYNPTSAAGDVGVESGSFVINADAIEESMLKAVDAAADEECLTYETTTGDFEWEDCNDGVSVVAGSDSYVQFNASGVLAGDSGFTFNSATDDVTVGGDLTITGDDLVMNTNTAGYLLIGGGSDYSPTAISGDATLAADGTLTVTSSAITPGSDTQIVFNDSGTLAADSGFTFNSATDDVTVGGDLTITGDDLVMNTNTAGYLLIGGGSDYSPTAISGDATLASDGAVTIAADAIEESMLKAVDAAADEECLTYETTTGDFEWENCNDGVDTTTAPGSSTEIIFNDGGVYGTDSNFTFNSVTDNLTIGGDLTITGDDLVMNTNTAGHIMVADGTNYNPVAVSGDVTIDSAGAVTIAADAIEESMLKAVDAAADEECLTYETTTGDFEWEDCNDGVSVVAGSDSYVQFNASGVLAGDSGFTFNSATDDVTVGGDLTITGDDLVMNTNTAGYLLIGGGSDYSPTAISGDATLASDGAVTIAADAIEESMLKAVDAAADEECLTYETTTGDFEWEDCNDGVSVVAGSDSYVQFNASGVLAGDSGFTFNSATDNLTIGGDLTITGDDLVMNTNTAGHIMVADGTNYNPVAVSGDVTIDSAGAVTIAADAIEESMLKAVDAAADEECLTYETTTGDFEWQSCGTTTAFEQDGNSFGGTATLGTNDANVLVFETNGSERVRIDTSGNTGIGTPSPANTLHAISTLNSVARFETSNTSGSTAGAGLLLVTNDGAAMGSGHRIGGLWYGGAEDSSDTIHYGGLISGFATEAWTSSANGTALAFETTPNGSTTRAERMRIDEDGHVGIGTNNPGSELDVDVDQDSYTGIYVRNDNDHADAYAGFTIDGHTSLTSILNHAPLRTVSRYGLTLGGWTEILAGASADADFDGLVIGTGSSVNKPIVFGINNTEMARLTSAGLGIKNTSPDVELDVTGDIEYSGTITDVSDRRLKTDIKPLDARGAMLDKLDEIGTYSFVMKDDENKRVEFGVIAQEIERVFPELVRTANDEMKTKSVNYVGLIAPLIEANKELRAENESLSTRIKALETDKLAHAMQLENIKHDVAGLKAHTGYGISKAQMGLWILIGALGMGLIILVGRPVWLSRRRD